MKEIKVKKKGFNSVGEYRSTCGCYCSCGYEKPYEGTYRPSYERAYDKNITPWSSEGKNK